MVQVLSGLLGPMASGGQDEGGAGAPPPSEPQMVLLILSLIALTARMSCKQHSDDFKNHTIFKWRWFATVEGNQKNVLKALKGIPKYKCSQYSIFPTSAVKSHCSPGKQVLAAVLQTRKQVLHTPSPHTPVSGHTWTWELCPPCLEFWLLGAPTQPG